MTNEQLEALSLTELKAQFYDQLAIKETAHNNMTLINNYITKKTNSNLIPAMLDSAKPETDQKANEEVNAGT